MKLTIITINYNNAAGLEKTILSIINQTYSDFEYIIIDGASSDDSVDIIDKYNYKINYWLSEKDNGIYNAMNKGILKSKGEYLLFINSGDILYCNKTLESIFVDNNPITDLVYGNMETISTDGKKNILTSPKHISIQHLISSTLWHPVTFIKRVLFKRYGLYREDLKIVSDWAFFLKIIAFGNVSQQHIDLTISTFALDGISNDPNNHLLMDYERDKVINESFSPELLSICNRYEKYYRSYNKKTFRIFRQISKIFKTITSRKKITDFIYRKRLYNTIRLINTTVSKQERNPLLIPIIIINYNRVSDLKKLIDFLIERKHENIVIVDNKSTYPPLLEYYEKIKDKVHIRFMKKNYGHLAFWKDKDLYNEFAKGYYAVTDSDIIPNNELPVDYMSKLLDILKQHKKITKVGFALRLDDIPDYFLPRKNVLAWERKFWLNELEPNIFKAEIDTTFALYPPCYKHDIDKFLRGIRVAGDFTARHGGWYINNAELSNEEKFYFQNSSASNSWKTDENGKIVNEHYLI